MVSRRWLLGSLLVGLLAGSWATTVQAEDPDIGDASLKETLVFGLKPRLPSEYAFIDLVVARVEAKTLPLELVIGTFRWARGRKPYAHPYFERAMRLRAAQIGVQL